MIIPILISIVRYFLTKFKNYETYKDIIVVIILSTLMSPLLLGELAFAWYACLRFQFLF